MKKNKLLIALAIAACSSAVMADEEINYSLGIKSWNNVLNNATPTSNINTQSQNAPLVTFVARKGDYFVSASALLKSVYTYKTAWLNRTDYDLALGYRVSDNISVLAGYKTLINTDGTQTNWKETNTGYFLGASGFKLIADQTYVYGNIQYVPSIKTKTTGTDYYRDMKFNSTEAGLGYVLNKSTQLTGGYRYQAMSNYNITQSRSEKTAVRGLLFGMNINF